MALIDIGFSNADLRVARLFGADFLIGFAFAEGCGGGAVFISWRLGDGAVFLMQRMTINRLVELLFPSLVDRHVLTSSPWLLLVSVYRLSSFLFVALPYTSSQGLPWL